MNKLFLLLIILLILLAGLLVYKSFFIDNVNDPTESPVVKVGENALYISTQRPGLSVIISRAILGEPGYVVIYEEDALGRPGIIIGNSRILPKGESINITAGLIKPTVHGQSLFGILHKDSGDGFFSPEIDIPIKDEYGNIISIRFSVDQSAP